MERYYWNGRILLRDAKISDAITIGKNMREADRKEIWSASRLRPYKACVMSLIDSQLAFAVEFDGVTVAIMGVVHLSLMSNRGVIWLLGTDGIDKLPITFGRHTKNIIEEFFQEWDSLENWVHKDNLKSLKWLRLAGFEIGDPQPYGVDKELFRRIRKERDPVCVRR